MNKEKSGVFNQTRKNAWIINLTVTEHEKYKYIIFVLLFVGLIDLIDFCIVLD